MYSEKLLEKVFAKTFYECNVKPLFEQTLREIDLKRDPFAFILRRYFETKLDIDASLLPNNFIQSLVKIIVTDLLALDKMFTDDQGFILIPSEGARLRRGADYFQIKAFIDTVIQACSNIANKMLDIPIEKLKPYQKTFIQAFSDESSNRNWKLEFSKHLTNEIAISKPFYIKIPD